MLASPPPLTVEPARSGAACETRDLRKAFGPVRAVDGLNLRIAPGELYAFLGPNGAGKTTTIRMIAGLLRPDSGDVLLHGTSVVTDPATAKRPLAYIPDEPPLYAKLRPMEHLEFVASLWSLPPAEARERGGQLLQRLGLWEKRDDLIETFSRGMKQKLALAAGFIHAPRILLLDEPLTGLDAAAARGVKDMMQAFVAEGGTVILTTHILEVAERLAQRIGIIHGGRLIAEGTLADLREQAGATGGTLEDIFLRVTHPEPPALS